MYTHEEIVKLCNNARVETLSSFIDVREKLYDLERDEKRAAEEYDGDEQEQALFLMKAEGYRDSAKIVNAMIEKLREENEVHF